MKKLQLSMLMILFVFLSASSIVLADSDNGQKIFKKSMRKACGISGVRFAHYHTQEEWKEIYESNRLPQEAKTICPKLKLENIKDSNWESIYEFIYDYASDSPEIPKC